MASRFVRFVPVVVLGAAAAGLAWAASRPDAMSDVRAAELTPDAGVAPDAGRPSAAPPRLDAGRARPLVARPHVETTPRDPVANTARVARGEIVEAPSREDYECLTPRIEIPRDPGCEAGEPYPACRWQVPGAHGAGDFYRVWRNTTPEHRWARPGLTSLVLAAAREYAARWPGEVMTVGDLDAAGVRHQTHDAGHDVDLYLENSMIDSNIGGGHYLATYAGRPARVVRLLRAQVMDLARILTTCAGGRVRIYYNDPEILVPFLAWFDEHGFVSDVGPAMVEHNRLHRFHFHLTIADDIEPLPVAPAALAPRAE